MELFSIRIRRTFQLVSTFEFDDRLVLVKDYYLGNPEEIRKRTKAVAEQGMIRR